jgi:hypothetical protein
MFSKVNGALRSTGARSTVAIIDAAIGSALHDVSQQDIPTPFHSAKPDYFESYGIAW